MSPKIDEALDRSAKAAGEAARKFIRELPPARREALMPGVGILLDGGFVPMRLEDLGSCIDALLGKVNAERERYEAALADIATRPPGDPAEALIAVACAALRSTRKEG